MVLQKTVVLWRRADGRERQVAKIVLEEGERGRGGIWLKWQHRQKEGKWLDIAGIPSFRLDLPAMVNLTKAFNKLRSK